MQSIQTLNALSHAIANFQIIYECGYLGTASWFVFITLMHSCYFCVMHPGVILGLKRVHAKWHDMWTPLLLASSSSLGHPVGAPQVF